MILHNIKLAFRNLQKDKLNSFINIMGLAIGMAAVILISIYVQHELSYDKHNTKHKRVYRLLSIMSDADHELVPHEICFRLTDEDFANQLPDIEEITQLLEGYYQDVTVGNNTFNRIECLNSDSNIHKVFSFDVMEGNPEQIFTTSNSVVLTQSTALKLFGKTDIVGNTLTMHDRNLMVSAVIKDLPKTSHFDFEILVPFSTFPEMGKYSSIEYQTYVLFKKNVNLENAIQKTKGAYAKILDDAFGEYGEKTDARLQNLCDIHLRSDYHTNLKPKGDINTVRVHILLACLILLIAIINFINIITVQYEGKINQIGVQKALGANRNHLIKTFLGRSLLLAYIALLIGIIIAEISLPHFSNLMSRSLEINYLNNPLLYLGLPVLALLVGILSGLYPAIVISKYSPSLLVKGIVSNKGKTNSLSKYLLIVQFSVSIILICCVVISEQQIDYMKHADLGFETKQVIAINNLSSKQKESFDAIKQELLKNPNIINVSASKHFPGYGAAGQMLRVEGMGEEYTKNINEYKIYPDYFKTLGIKFVQGSTFNEGDSNSIILNEAAVDMLNKDAKLGSYVRFHGKKYEIRGIVKNFHYSSLRDKIDPLMFTPCNYIHFILFKVRSENMTEIIQEAKEICQQFDPGHKNFHMYVDDRNRNRYKNEERSQSLISYSSILSILLALLGLYTLSLFMVQKRTKEVGIRKVVGASELQITSLLFSNFAKWISIAFVISVPVAWLIMNHWLEQFTYHIEIGILPFVIAGTITFVFALLTVVFQTWRAAIQNPVESLRYE